MPTVPVSGLNNTTLTKCTASTIGKDPDSGYSILSRNKYEILPLEEASDLNSSAQKIQPDNMCKAKSELSHRKSISSQGSKPICESDSIMLQHVISPYFKCSKENAGTIMQFSSRAVSRRQRRDHKLNSVSSFCELSITATPASNNYRVSLLKCIFLRFEN